MVDVPQNSILTTPDDLERAEQRATRIVRGRWLTILVIVIALGGAVLDVGAGLLESSSFGGAGVDLLVLSGVAICSFLLYKGHEWGKRAIAGYLGYAALREALGLVQGFLFAARLGEQAGSSSDVLLGWMIVALLAILILGVPVTALIILFRSRSVGAFLESQRHVKRTELAGSTDAT